jgi:hypothetical protein
VLLTGLILDRQAVISQGANQRAIALSIQFDQQLFRATRSGRLWHMIEAAAASQFACWGSACSTRAGCHSSPTSPRKSCKVATPVQSAPTRYLSRRTPRSSRRPVLGEGWLRRAPQSARSASRRWPWPRETGRRSRPTPDGRGMSDTSWRVTPVDDLHHLVDGIISTRLVGCNRLCPS